MALLNNITSGVPSQVLGQATKLIGSSSILGNVGKVINKNVQGLLLGSPSYIQYENSAYQEIQENFENVKKKLEEKLKNKEAEDNSSDEETTKLSKQVAEAQNKFNQTEQNFLIYFDIIRKVEVTADNEVPEHPVEDGYSIHDNIYNKPRKITIEGAVASSPVTWIYKLGSGKDKITHFLSALKKFRDTKTVCTFIRCNGTIYENIVLQSYSYSRTDESLSVIWVTMSFVEIVKVKTETTDIPPEVVAKAKKSGAGGTVDGDADSGTLDKSGSRNVSALKGSWDFAKQKWEELGLGEAYRSGKQAGRAVSGG